MRLAFLAPLALVAATGGIASADPTQGAVPAEQIRPLVPKQLAGIAPSNSLDYPWAVAIAYKLPDGTYANLDIQNTFHRGQQDTAIEDLNSSSPRLCPKKEKVTGYVACVRVDTPPNGGAAIRWYLPDRLTVRIAAPTEALARKMAADLPIAKLAALSAKK